MIVFFDHGFNFAATGTVVNGTDDFAFGSVRILDGFLCMTVHQRPAIRTAHCFLFQRDVLATMTENFRHPDKLVEELVCATHVSLV